ncbi:hypothetical protein AVEN_145005-1 [Araneus ventricosus]|uniref:Uncharacterized protein n=1 Tax=Araneus ventricosus TaxID=182803 RepID=A0A4Y2QST0_ARAVE|nr:hypothetical protein AVEN_145005-1 [Araneus ventricosus]
MLRGPTCHRACWQPGQSATDDGVCPSLNYLLSFACVGMRYYVATCKDCCCVDSNHDSIITRLLVNCRFIKLITDAFSRDDRNTQRYNKFSHTQEVGESEACTKNLQKQIQTLSDQSTGVQHPIRSYAEGVEELDFLWRENQRSLVY